MWYLKFRSSGKLARFYSSPTHHWMLFFFSAQVASGLQGHTTTWWSWEQNFQVDFLLNVCKSHQIISSTTMLIHIKIKMISRINQILVEIFLPNSHKYNAYSALHITTTNIILTIITMALLIFQVRSNRPRFRIGSNAVSHVAQSKSYVPLHI